MSRDYKRLRLRRFGTVEEADTPEARFWKRFNRPVLAKQLGPVSSIHFSPVDPYDFAVTSSTRVVLYDCRTNKVRRQISRFNDNAYSGHFRRDGKLLCAGTAGGVIKVFDAKSRSILRVFRGHRGPVQCTKFAPSNTHLVSTGDDKSVRMWDLTSGTNVAVLNGHTDYVRTADASNSSSQLWATGSYDHTVRVWDLRAHASSGGSDGGDSAVAKLNHGAPVEAVLMLPGGGSVLSAGGNTLKVWDLLGGGRLLQEFSAHQKTITAVGLDGTGTRLLSGSEDGHVKVYDLSSFETVYGIKYTAPILSLACSPDNSRLVVGMADHMLSIRSRVVQLKESVAEKRAAAALRGGSYRYFIRGQGARAAPSDYVVATERKKRLQPYDDALKRFQYREALNEALKTRNPIVVVTVLEELAQRGDGLHIALSGRDEALLEPLVAFVAKYLTHPRYSMLIDVCHKLFDIYAPVLGRSVPVDSLFLRLKAKVSDEIKLQKGLLSLQGALDLVMASATSSTSTQSESAPSAPVLALEDTGKGKGKGDVSGGGGGGGGGSGGDDAEEAPSGKKMRKRKASKISKA